MTVDAEILAIAAFCGARAVSVDTVPYRGTGERSTQRGWRVARALLAPERGRERVALARDGYRVTELRAEGADDARAKAALRVYVEQVAKRQVEAVAEEARGLAARAEGLRAEAVKRDDEAAARRSEHATRSAALEAALAAGGGW